MPLRRAANRSELVNTPLNTFATSSLGYHVFAYHHLANPLNRCILLREAEKRPRVLRVVEQGRVGQSNIPVSR